MIPAPPSVVLESVQLCGVIYLSVSSSSATTTAVGEHQLNWKVGMAQSLKRLAT